MQSAAFECVINLSEGTDRVKLDCIVEPAADRVLDIHCDPDHNRAVVTLGSTDPDAVEEAARALARGAVETLDLRNHHGVHPRMGVVDVVPFVPVGNASMEEAVGMRDRFADWAGEELAVPCFVYGPERSLPEVRKAAFDSLEPSTGPPRPHPSAGAIAVGARHILVAYNIWLECTDVEVARAIASTIRGPYVRALGLPTGLHVQVSCNLIAPDEVGPAEVYDEISTRAAKRGVPVGRAELVGLIPRTVFRRIDPVRLEELDLSEDRTIEARLGL